MTIIHTRRPSPASSLFGKGRIVNLPSGSAGYHSCDELRNGTSVLDEMATVETIYQLPPGQGTLVVSAATTNLCPGFAG